MNSYIFIYRLALVALTATIPALSPAVGRLIPAPQRVDMVYDDFRGLLYITQGSQVLRYNLDQQTFLPPYNLVGGNLRGIDISDDGTTLAVADLGFPGMHTIDLETSQTRKVSSGESLGPPSVAFAGDGSILMASGEQWGAMRRYVPKTNTLQTLFTSMRHRSMLCTSADGGTVAFAEGDISSGQWGRYRTSDGNVQRMTGYTDGTSWFNFEIGVNFDATQYAIPTYGGCFIYNSALAKIATVGVYASGQPIGVVYHPVEDLVYFPWATTNSIYVYNTKTLTKVGEYDFQNAFTHTGNASYTEGRVKTSVDGKILFCTVDGGVRYFRISDAPVASNQQVTLDEDSAVSITLSATDDNTSDIIYSIVSNPTRGKLSGTLPNLTYTPNANYAGADSFTFKANDGMQDSPTASVSITVTNVPDAPVASALSLSTKEDTPLNITLNGTDPDSTALTYTTVTLPQHGVLNGSGKNLQYVPAANYSGSDSFSYKVSDGSLDSNPASVQITITAVQDAPVVVSSSYITSEDTPVSVTLEATDPENDPITYRITGAPAHGTLSGTAPNIVFTPAPNYYGTDSFTFKANDGQLDSLTGTIHLDIVSQPDEPTGTSDTITLDEDTTAAVTLRASDPEESIFTYSIVQAPTHGTLTGSGADYVYTPDLNFAGTDSVLFTANNSGLSSDPAQITLIVRQVNDAPVIVSQKIIAPQGKSVSFSIEAFDVEDSPLEYTLTAMPATGILSGTLPDLTFSPSKKLVGLQLIQYTVSDGDGVSTGSVEILYLPKNKGLVAFPDFIATGVNESVDAPLSGWTSLDQPMHYTIKKQPKHGTLSGLIPNLRYMPEPGFSGLDKFTFRITCGPLKSKTVTVKIMVGTGR